MEGIPHLRNRAYCVMDHAAEGDEVQITLSD